MAHPLPLQHRVLARGARNLGKGLTLIAANAHRFGWLPGNEDVRVVRDIPYTHRGGKQCIDVYLPRRIDHSRPLPFVYFIHGGAWVLGDRKVGTIMGRVLASRGIAVVTAGYRLAPGHGLHEQLDDVKKALQFTLHSGSRWNLDTSRYAIVGESAGAHLTMRLLQEFPGLLPGTIRPKAVVSFYGPYDLDIYRRVESPWVRGFLRTISQGGDVVDLIGSHGAMKELPWTDVPVFLIHGDSDNLVPVQQSVRMRKLLEKQGVPVELKIYAGAGHGFNYQSRSNPQHTIDSYREVVKFFRRHVGE